MNDLSPDERLAKLRALEEWLDWQLNNTRQKIRTIEAQVEQERRQRQSAYAESHWKLQPRRGSGHAAILHRGGCGLWRNEMGYLTRDEVLLALTDDELTIEMCQICRPETGLQTD